MTAIRLRGATDVLAALPYQLGYHPEDSVVVLALSGGLVGLVARLDLPPPPATAEAADSLVVPVLRSGFDAVVVVGFESAEGAAEPVLDELASRFEVAGVDIVHRLLVRDGRWFSLDCAAECCPSEGEPLPDPASTPVVADFVGLGRAPRARRADLADAVAADPGLSELVARELATRPPAPPGAAFFRDGPPDDELRVAARRVASLSVWRDVLTLDVDHVGDGVDLSTGPGRPQTRTRTVRADEVARLVVSLRDVELRDGLLAWLCPGFLAESDLSDDLVEVLESTLGPFPDAASAPGPARPEPWSGAHRLLEGNALVERIGELLRAVPQGDGAPMATVLAYVAWYQGEGTLARVAIDRALGDVPDYRLARLVDQLLDLGLRPSALGLAPPPMGHERAVQFPDVGR